MALGPGLRPGHVRASGGSDEGIRSRSWEKVPPQTGICASVTWAVNPCGEAGGTRVLRQFNGPLWML